jgi:hypothetical protein
MHRIAYMYKKKNLTRKNEMNENALMKFDRKKVKTNHKGQRLTL